MSTNEPRAEGDGIEDPVTRSYRENDFRGSLLEQLDAATLSWLATTDQTWDDVVAIERVRRENPDVYSRLMAAVDDDVRRRIVGVLAMRGQATYSDFQEYIGDVSRRTVKNHVWALRDDGVLHVGDGNPAAVSFADDAVDLLARDALSFHPEWTA